MAPVEHIDFEANDEQESAPVEPEFRPAPRRLWPPFLIAIAAFEAACWVLDAIPPRAGETLALRWLRALAEHPLRGPLGLTLAYLGLAQLVRALFNRATRA